jgi:hypothetical protein
VLHRAPSELVLRDAGREVSGSGYGAVLLEWQREFSMSDTSAVVPGAKTSAWEILAVIREPSVLAAYAWQRGFSNPNSSRVAAWAKKLAAWKPGGHPSAGAANDFGSGHELFNGGQS